MSGNQQPSSELSVFERRADRERKARKEAEKLLVEKTREVYLAHQSTKSARDLLDMAMWASGESIWDLHANSDSCYYRFVKNDNKELCESRITLSEFRERVHKDDLPYLDKEFDAIKQGSFSAIDRAIQVRDKSGNYRWQRIRGRAIEFDREGKSSRAVGTILDIDTSVQTEESYKLMSYVFSRAREPMIILSAHFDIIEVNDALLRKLNANKNAFQNWPLHNLINLEDSQFADLLNKTPEYHEASLNFDDTSIPVEVTLNEFSFAERGKPYIVCICKDLTERKLTQNQLHRLAHYDSLTNLLNRNALQSEVAQKIADEPNRSFAMLFIDLDGFKDVNDAMGHEAGDRLLQNISEVLKHSTLENTTLARWGGDEFVAVCNFQSNSQWQHQAQAILNGFRTSELDVKKHGFKITASIGISMYPEHGNDVDTIVRNADLAMYEAKLKGKNQWVEYHPSLTAKAIKRIKLVNQLAVALSKRSFEFYVQGKYDRNAQLNAAEVLARWTSPTLGPVSPSEFVPLIEQHGMANELGFLAIRAGASYIRRFIDNNKPVEVSVNVSSMQVMEASFLHEIKRICDEEKAPYHLLELEVTESVFLDNPALAERRLKDIQKAGFSVSLDDFGTGYSSLSYLRQIDFDTVKIDRSFLTDIHNDKRAYNLLSSLLKMCQALESKVVVEGVETQQDLAILLELGYQNFQGYYFCRPMPIDEFLANKM
jgi:diguanylate cyclase (GGDEF)-like protein